MVTLDAQAFQRRIKRLVLTESDHLLVAVGSASDASSYSKSTALQTWLLGYEFPDTVFLYSKDEITFIASQKKGGIFETLIKEDQKVKINVLKRTNDEEADKALFQSLVSKMSGSKVGIIPKDSFDGKFYNSWKTAFEAAKESFEIMDATTDIAVALSQKDDEEMKLVRMASKVTSSALKNLLVEELESILDEDKSTTHENLAAKVEEYLQNPKLKTRLKLSNDVEVDLIDWCYTPIIQSGEKFDLRPSAVSNSDNLSSDVIVCSLGLRYKSYCANIGRTFLIDPEKSKEKNYKFLVELEDYIISIMKEGVTCKDVYLKAQSYIEQKRPDLKDNFLKMCGFGMGIEFRESTFALNPKNTRPIKSGMIFNLYIGLQGLKEAGKEYALFLSDTVRVTLDGCVMLTDMPREASEISYIFKDGENENLAPEKSVSPIKPRRSAIMPSKTRSEGKDEVSSEQRRMNHQKQLALAKQQEGEARFSGGADRSKEEQQMVFRKFESYKKDTFLPKQTRDLKILIDKKNDSIILPIHGLPVPFHLSTLKNVTKSDEGDFVYLRFNFVTPGQTLGRKENTPFENPNATFIRAISFRSADVYRFTEIFRQINDLKKDLTKRETQQKEMADLVVQDKLIEVKGRRPLRLAEVFPRPALEGKRVHGDFEIHQNGLRFVSPLKADQKIDILFSNVKHLFFQPCDGELIVLIHIHLKNHIMIGKKKTKDVQFYREVVDANFDETGNRKRRYNYGDEDELAAEQEERRRRIQLNKEFKEFAEKIGEASKGSIEVDVPFRDLAFSAVPNRQLVLMQPTTDCLVHLTDPPFTVISLAEIEIAHLERVQFGLKNFDLVLVFKDFSRPVVHLNTIPMTQLDNVKEWLDSVDVAFSEGPVNLNWSQIMKTVNEDPKAFFAEGGWSFLHPESEESDVEESASEFEHEEESEEESESDFSEEEENSESEDYSEEDEESGEDWDELERKAARADERKRPSSQEGGSIKKMRR